MRFTRVGSVLRSTVCGPRAKAFALGVIRRHFLSRVPMVVASRGPSCEISCADVTGWQSTKTVNRDRGFCRVRTEICRLCIACAHALIPVSDRGSRCRDS